jgi:hypothetical protein
MSRWTGFQKKGQAELRQTRRQGCQLVVQGLRDLVAVNDPSHRGARSWRRHRAVRAGSHGAAAGGCNNNNNNNNNNNDDDDNNNNNKASS